jgi:hypothetical protein
MSVIIDGTSGITSPTLDLTSGQLSVADGGTGSATGENLWRNKIINGGMKIDQRFNGGLITFTAGGALGYTLDRWYGYATGANATAQRVSGTGANQYNMQFNGLAGTTALGFGQRIESFNAYDLAGQTATLSVNLANSLLTSVTWTAYYANTTDAFGTLASPTRTQIATGTFTVTSTLTQYTTNISMPANAINGVEIVFTVGAQTSGTWTIGSVQLEKGSTATSFENRPYGTELNLCLRYYWDSNPGSATATLQVGGYAAGAGGYTTASLTYPVPMRASPTLSTRNGSGSNATAVSVSASGLYIAATSITASGSGNSYWTYNVQASAEL